MAHEKIWVSLLNSATYRQDLEATLMNVVYMRYRQLIAHTTRINLPSD